MMFKILYLLLFIPTSIFAQFEFEYFGVIELDKESLISYKISFNEENGFIKGQSLTDLGGAHETLSLISGFFDDKNNILEFNESSIIYTKSFETKEDFCFVNFKGKLKKLNERQQIEGSFKGLYTNGEKCINGTILLTGVGKMLKRAEKIDKKIDRSIVISKEKKDKVNLLDDFNKLNKKIINKNEKVSFFTADSKIQLIILDSEREDGDKISISINNKISHNEIVAKNKKQIFDIPLSSETTLVKITALNNGDIGDNTVKIIIKDSQNTVDVVSNLKKEEFSILEFVKE